MVLKATKREVIGKKVKNLRAEKQVPASVYGPGFPSANITVNDKEFRQLYRDSGYSKLFDLEVEGEKSIKALLKEVQVDHIKGRLIHVSIYAVDLTKPITTSIPIKFTGLSMAVKNNLGLLVISMDSVNVTCLPEKLTNEIVISIDKLDNVGDSIFLKELPLPEGVTTFGYNRDMVVAAISSPQKAAEEDVKTAAAGTEGEAAAEGDEKADAKAPAKAPAKAAAKK